MQIPLYGNYLLHKLNSCRKSIEVGNIFKGEKYSRKYGTSRMYTWGHPLESPAVLHTWTISCVSKLPLKSDLSE